MWERGPEGGAGQVEERCFDMFYHLTPLKNTTDEASNPSSPFSA